MPWMIPSHQAPVLPLKRWRPHWFSGLALVLGTVAPDLAFVLRLDEDGSPLSHSLVGLFVVDVPLGMVLHALATALVLPWLLPHLPGRAPLHLHALARCRPVRDAAGLARVAFSVLVGAATHVLIDGFTHGNHAGWALAFLPALGLPVLHLTGTAPLHDALQFWLTIGLGAVALRDWDRMASALPAPGPGAAAAWEVVKAPLQARRQVVALLVGAALGGAALAPLLKGAIGSPDALKLAAYGAITGGTVAALLGALADRVRRILGAMDKPPGTGLGSHSPRCFMAVNIRWQPPLVPEERKKAQWENIIRFELGEGVDGLDVSLRFAEERLRWQLNASGPEAASSGYAAACRGRLVDALRAHGKPVE